MIKIPYHKQLAILVQRLSVLFTIIILIIIGGLSLYPSPPDIHSRPGMDKVFHFIAYAALGFFLYPLFGKRKSDTEKALLLRTAAGHIFLAVFIGTVYGGALEILQHFTGRTSDLIDLFADTAGSFSGALFSLLFDESSKLRES